MRALLILAILWSTLSACTVVVQPNVAPAVTPIPTDTPEPTTTPLPPTPVQTATTQPTVVPTDTAIPATDTPPPSATPLPPTSTPVPTPTPLPTLAWYSGGTLHKATWAEWKSATTENKMATAADWITNVYKPEWQTFAELRTLSEQLVICVDEVTDTSIAAWGEDSTVVDMVVTCIILMME